MFSRKHVWLKVCNANGDDGSVRFKILLYGTDLKFKFNTFMLTALNSE